ncbi:amphoterin-induced protein 2 [Rhinatrema bivittatum]|uniref:amphoterin-induced protein 2 n=1 Tax=Rhinatrema bivittatum TaxID=194408 RepID=UPI00112A9A6D|nr:amphoterin-induced protein 2 [Rhinatrema bivittatum]
MFLSCQFLSTILGILKVNCKGFVCLVLVVINISGCVSSVCPAACICASDIVSCTNKNLSMVPRTLFKFIKSLDLSYNKIGFLDPDWIPVLFDKLNTLILNHNSVSSISTGSFSATPNVRYLDLSSNSLRTLSNPVFQELKSLEVLLLYNNQITHVDSDAFGGLHKLQKLYLSRNSLTYFPVDLYIGRIKLTELVLLDVSYNHLQTIPVQQLSLVPARQLCGIYLHGNPFFCDCTYNSMLNFWFHRHFSPVVDFKNDYTCFLHTDSKGSTKFALVQENFLNCSDSSINGSFHAFGFLYEVQVGERLVVHCDSKLIDASTHFFWVSPDSRLLEPGNKTEHFQVFHNGSLELEKARFEDSGVYSCIAINKKRLLNETIDIRITVSNFTLNKSPIHEAFNTAFTTLAACVVSIILVLLYLYLTPCHCPCKSRRQQRKQNQSSAHSSILSATPSHDPPMERKSSTGKRVVFLEPMKEQMQGQNGKVRLFPNENLMAESILKPNRPKTDSDSISSVFSDTPFMATA